MAPRVPPESHLPQTQKKHNLILYIQISFFFKSICLPIKLVSLHNSG